MFKNNVRGIVYYRFQTDFFSAKIYDKRDDFDFVIVNVPFLDGDVPRSSSFTFLNLFGLLECLVMWLISMPVIKV